MPRPPEHPDPVPELKRQLMREINLLIDQWSQQNAAEILEQNIGRISELRNMRIERFTLDRLVRFLHVLGRRVEISTSTSRKRGVLDYKALERGPSAQPMPARVYRFNP